MKAYPWRVVTPPEGLILAVADVRDDHLRSPNGSAEDAYIESLIKAATAMAEQEMRRSLQVQTLVRTLDAFGDDDLDSDGIVLPRSPIIEVETVTYLDGAGDSQTVDADGYVLAETGRDMNTAGRLVLANGANWPSSLTQAGAVSVTYRAGYTEVGTSPEVEAVPESILQGIRLVVGELYKQRSLSVHLPNQHPAILAAKNLWNLYKVYP